MPTWSGLFWTTGKSQTRRIIKPQPIGPVEKHALRSWADMDLVILNLAGIMDLVVRMESRGTGFGCEKLFIYQEMCRFIGPMAIHL